MKDLIAHIAKALVDKPEEVVVTEIEGQQIYVIELKVANGQSTSCNEDITGARMNIIDFTQRKRLDTQAGSHKG
jgi:hypothetical protein